MNKTILIVGAGGNQVGMIKKARALGLRTIAMDGNPGALGFAHADVAEAANILDPAEIIRIAQTHRGDAIYAAAELAVEAVAQATTRLGLPGLSPEVAARVRNKFVMRQALAAQGIPTPAFRGVRTLSEAQEAVGDIGLPVIVKPADGSASKGVRRVDSADQLPNAFARAFERSRSDLALIEAFMEGEEWGVDGLVYDGRYILGGITAKERSAPPNRFDLGLHMPPLESAQVVHALVDAVERALKAIEFTAGTTHIEVIMTDAGPRIVEMAGRPGGARIPTDLVPLTYGMDFIADSLRIALGESPREQRCYERGAAIYWIPAEPGLVTAISGFDEARAVPGVREIVLATKPGESVEAIVDCATRDKIGYVLTDGENAQAAIAAAKHALRACRVVTRPLEAATRH